MYRIALFSDIHGNAIALREVLLSIESRGVDQVVCMRYLALLFVLLAGLGCSAGEPAPASSDLSEASMNFDLAGVRPFLLRVAGLVGGFGTPQIDPLVAEIEAMANDEEGEWSFDVSHDGKPVRLLLRVHMDGVAAPNLYFFTSPELASVLQQEMIAYAEDLGL